MERVWFLGKGQDSPYCVATLPDGTIPLRNLADHFQLDTTSVVLDGVMIPSDSGGINSAATWGELKNALNLSPGTEEAPVIVDGRGKVVALAEQPSKRRKTARKAIQLFVQSAAESYRKWERDYQLALPKVGEDPEEVGEDPEEMRRPFLELKSDPLGNYHYGFLLWVSEFCTDMKDILSAAEPGQRFTILGESGVGKSLFTVFWICYRATLQEKVVWKQGEQGLYLLDFSAEPSAKAYDPWRLDHPDIQEVLDDENAWLVIDGRQAENLVCECKIVQACCMREKNYREFSKNPQVSILYFPAWDEEEICEFVDEFEQHRLKYKEMNVPVKDDALRYFRKIGGVARYVLCGRNSERRLKEVESAMLKLTTDNVLQFCTANFEKGETLDALQIISCHIDHTESGVKKYSNLFYEDSFDVGCRIRELLEQYVSVDYAIQRHSKG